MARATSGHVSEVTLDTLLFEVGRRLNRADAQRFVFLTTSTGLITFATQCKDAEEFATLRQAIETAITRMT